MTKGHFSFALSESSAKHGCRRENPSFEGRLRQFGSTKVVTRRSWITGHYSAMRDATRKALDAAKRDVEAGRLDDAFKRAGNLLRYLSGQEYEEAREEWSTFLWGQSEDFSRSC